MIEIPIDIDFIDGDGCHITVDVTLNDAENGLFIIDTGASKTVLDKDLTQHLLQPISPEELNNELEQSLIEKLSPEQKKQLGLEGESVVSVGVGPGKIDFNFGVLQKLNIGNFETTNFYVAYIDLSNVNNLYEALGKPKIWGLLGGDFLLEHNAIIDYKQRKMFLSE